ncbi:MAG: YdcH family protein [Paracoccaceae bacterium]
MSTEARLRSLEDRHGSLDRRITEEEIRPLPDTEELHRLKREKLRIKDEMERLRLERAH